MSRQPPIGPGRMRQAAAAGLAAGQRFVTRRTFTAEDVRAFAVLSRDYNPVHFDKGFAAAKGFGDTICHGLLVAGMITEIGGQVGWLASRMDFRFRRPVYVGDTIECRLTIERIDARHRATATAACTNQHGQVVIEARLEGIVPAGASRRELQRILAAGDPDNPLPSDP